MWRNTDCRTVSELLWNYAAARLPEQEVELVEQHLVGCGPCRAEADAYRLTVDAVEGMRRDPIPQSRRGWRELEARLLAPPVRRPFFGKIQWGFPQLAWGGAAAAVLLFLVYLPQIKRPTDADSGPGGQSASAPGPRGAARQIEQSAPSDELTYSDSVAEEMMAASDPERQGIRVKGAKVRGTSRAGRSIALAQSDRSRIATFRLQRRRRTGLDYAHVDGNVRQSGFGGMRDYVLTSVSAQSDADTSSQYVMGSLVMADRSDDTGVALGW